jgi:hypothetical protein
MSTDKKRIVALCDECELYWDDIQAVYDDEFTPSSGAYPALNGEWRAASREEVKANGLDDCVRGESE